MTSPSSRIEPHVWRIAIVVILGAIMSVLDTTIVNVALQTLSRDLHTTLDGIQWVVTGYLLALAAVIPVSGWAATRFGARRVYLVSIVLFTLGSLLSGLAWSAGSLIGARVIQGLGVGGLTALVQVILADLVSPRERGRYAGYLGAVFGVGTVIGPLLGGIVTDSFGWRWCFYIGVPFAIAAFVVLQRTLHLPRKRRRDVSIDYLGATLIAGGGGGAACAAARRTPRPRTGRRCRSTSASRTRR